jgi:hypothetical protein
MDPGQEAKFQQLGYGQVLPALFLRIPGPYQRDYYTSANYESLQEVKDPRGPVGMTARRKRRLWCSQPPLEGPLRSEHTCQFPDINLFAQFPSQDLGTVCLRLRWCAGDTMVLLDLLSAVLDGQLQSVVRVERSTQYR